MNQYQKVKFSEIARLKYGKEHKNLNNGAIKAFGSGGVIRFVDSYIYDKESVLIPRKGSLSNIFYSDKPFWVVDTMFYTEINSQKCFPKYLYYYFTTIDFLSLNSSSAIPSLTTQIINELQIPLPPLKEQEKIARILGVWDSALDTLANLIKAKRKYKTALMQRLLTPPKDIDCKTKSQITPSLAEGARGWVNPRNDKTMDCHENPYGFAGFASESRNDTPPRHCEEALATKQSTKESLRFAEFSDKWQEFRLGDIGQIYQPQTIPQSDFAEIGYNVYGANGIIGKYHSYNHEKAQIAIACRGNSCGVVNFTSPKSWITGNAMVINLDNSKVADKTFAYYALLNSNLNYLITGSGQPQITGNIKNHKIKLPTLAEQKKIAQVLSVCDKEIETLNLKFECLKAQKKGLMQQLLSGKIRVKCENAIKQKGLV